MQLKGNIRMPKQLESLLKAVGVQTAESPAAGKEGRDQYNESDYLSGPRKVDILLLTVFYGFYSTVKLPPLEVSEFPCDGTYEFSANVEKEISMLRNALLLLWLSKNEALDHEREVEYRRKLYDFLDIILDDDFVTNVVFPYYSSEAAREDGDISFIHKLASSRFVEWKMRSHAPEYIALDFVRVREQFEKKVLAEIPKQFLSNE